MKKTLYTIILLLPFIYLKGQELRIDSLTRAIKSTNKKEDLSGIKYILKHRSSERMQKRLDSIPYDYAFIIETYCSVDPHETKTIEYYFKKNDQTAFVTYAYNDKGPSYAGGYFSFCFEDIDQEAMKYYDHTLSNMKDIYSSFKPIQKISYPHTQIYSHACIRNESQYRERRTKELKHTWQIQTSIKKGGELKISVQYPDPDPEFKIRSCGGKW